MLLPVGVFFGVSRAASKRITQPIAELSDGVREIAAGNLDKKLDIHTGDEIESLAVSFNAMTDELKIYMANLSKETAERERISTELNVAFGQRRARRAGPFQKLSCTTSRCQ